MAVIGSMQVNVLANINPFAKNMGRGRKEIGLFQKSVNSTGASIGRFATGLAGAAAAFVSVRAAVRGVRQAFEDIDRVAKLSSRSGFSTEAIVAFERGAEQAGASASGLGKGLETFNKRLGEVKLGTGEAKDALEALGLSADTLTRMTPEDALARVSDELRKLPTHAERAAVAAKLFGRAGSGELLNFLTSGSEAMSRMQDEARRLGITFSSESAAGVEAANDAIGDMKASFTGLARTAAIELAPSIKTVADGITSFVETLRGTGAFEGIFDAVLLGAAKLADFITDIKLGIMQLQAISAGAKANILGEDTAEGREHLRNAAKILADIESIERSPTAVARVQSFQSDRALNAAEAAARADLRQASSKPRFSIDLEGDAAARAAAPTPGVGSLGSSLASGIGLAIRTGLGNVTAAVGGADAAGGALGGLLGPQSQQPQLAGAALRGSLESFQAINRRNSPEVDISKKQLAALNELIEVAKQQAGDAGRVVKSFLGGA